MDEVQPISSVDMIIVKASREKADGTMRLRMVNSDTGEDVYGEKMSVELFEDFIQRSDDNLPVPEPFDTVVHEEKWQGGKPYLSVAHYKSDAFDELPGEQEKLYLDGEKLKSVDVLYDNDLGNRIWKSVYNDLYAEEKDFENPVRVSIGFIDLEHKHEIKDGDDFVFTRKSLEDKCELCTKCVENKVYLKGHLVHKAFTRVPAHPRTDVEIEMKSSDIMTKKDDAESIIGSDIELEQKSQVVEDILVVKSEKDLEDYAWSVRGSFYDEFSPPMYVRTVTENSVIVSESGTLYRVGYSDGDKGFSFDKRSAWERVEIGYISVKSEAGDDGWRIEFDEEISTEKSVNDEVIMKDGKSVEAEAVPAKKVEVVPEEEVTPKSEVVEFAKILEDKLAELAEKGIYGEEALKEIQPMFNELGEVVKSKVTPQGALGDVAGVIKSTMQELIPTLKQEIVSQLVKELSGLTVQSVAPVLTDEVPAPRSIEVKRSNITEQGQKQLSQIERLAGLG